MNATILIVDDSPTQRMSLQIALKKYGYEIVSAENGIEGVNRAYESMPHVVVSDIVMPELNGYQFCRILKNDPDMKDIPFLLLTSLGESVHKFWGMEAGADHYLTKESGHEAILEKIEDILEKNPPQPREPGVSGELDDTVQSKVNEIFDDLLYEFTVSNRLKELSQLSHDPDSMYREVFYFLRQLFDFSYCSLIRTTPTHVECLMNLPEGVEPSEMEEINKEAVHALPEYTRSLKQQDSVIRAEVGGRGGETGKSFLVHVGEGPDAVIAFTGFRSQESDKRTDKTLKLIVEELGRTFNYLYKLEEIESVKADFSSMIVHDLRSPLTSIIGFASMMEKKLTGKVDEKTVQMTGIIQKNGKRMLELVNDFLDISKIEAGKMEVHPQVASISGILDDVHKSCTVLAQEKNIDFILELEESLPEINLDANRIEQVMINLLSNAIKFTPEGGTIHMGCKNQPEEKNVNVWVKDSGVGMEEKDVATLFQKYKQTKSAQTTKKKGTGLGLVICKHIVEAHGGNIRVESKINEGTTFSFTLPHSGPPEGSDD